MRRLSAVSFFIFTFFFTFTSMAYSGMTITFRDGKQVHAATCRFESNDIYYTLPRSDKVYQTSFDEVEGVSNSDNTPEVSVAETQQTPPAGKNLAGNAQPGDNRQFMKRFADKVYRFFEFEPQIREAALNYARDEMNNRDKTGRHLSIMDLLNRIDVKTGINYMTYFKEESGYNGGKLNSDEKYIVDKTLEGMMFYMAQLPGEEGMKAGIIPFKESHESETPDVLKNYIKVMLAPYKYNKTVSEAETKKELMALWNKMKTALSQGDVEGASLCFSASTRDGYKRNFKALKDSGALQKAAGGMGGMKVVKVRVGTAEGDMRVREGGKERSYLVRFIMEGEGGWKIQSY